jgi:hypothetical protein
MVFYSDHRRVSGVSWINAAIDLVIGAVIFLALGISLITFIHFIHPQDGTALFDLPTLFAELANPATRGNYLWLALMLGTTLIPTLLHLMIGIGTLGLQYPKRVRRWIIHKLISSAGDGDTEGPANDGFLGSAAICGIITLSFCLPIITGALVIRYSNGHVIDAVIAPFHWWATAIGAI